MRGGDLGRGAALRGRGLLGSVVLLPLALLLLLVARQAEEEPQDRL